MTDQELKIEISKLVPDLICFEPFCMVGDEECEHFFRWLKRDDEVTEEEWAHLVRAAITRITTQQFREFVKNLDNGTNKPQFLTWQQRAEALIQTLSTQP